MMREIPSIPGAYILHLELKNPVRKKIGSLGEQIIPMGEFLYFGSARGPGGIRSRLKHHCKPIKKEHWHIDRLVNLKNIDEIWYVLSHDQLECFFCQKFISQDVGKIVIPRFGSSDCKSGCPAHFVKIPTDLNLKNVMKLLQSSTGLELRSISKPILEREFRQEFIIG